MKTVFVLGFSCGLFGVPWVWAVYLRDHQKQLQDHQKHLQDKKQETRLVQATNQRKTLRTERAGNTKSSEVRVGEREKCSQRKVLKKASKITLYREIVERERYPDGSQNATKRAFLDWYSTLGIFRQKWTLAILGPHEKQTPKKLRDVFGRKKAKSSGKRRASETTQNRICQQK